MNKKLLVLLPTVAMLLAGCTPAKTSSQAESAGTDVTSAVQSQDQSNSQGGSSATQEVVSEVQIDPTSVTLDIGGTKQINGVVKPATLSNRTIVWSSDKPEVATVSDGGLVTAKGAGVARIKAASQLDPTKFVECVVTVNGKKVLGYAYTPVVGQKYAFGTYQANKAVKANIYAKMADFDSSNGRFETTKNFAEAAQFTLENGSANGKYRIKVSDGTNNKYLNLRSADDYHITLGDTAVTDWSWNEEYCTLVADAAGRTNFVGTYNNYTTLSSCDILQAAGDYVARLYQQADPADATAIDIYPNQNLTCYAGAALYLQARISPIGAQDKEVTWSISGNDKCTINNGKLVAALDATGTVKVTAKVNDTIKKEVTVTIGEALNFGTKEAPLTTAQAKALLDKVGSGIITEHQMYVKGIVASSSYSTEYKNYTTWLDGADKDTGFELYSAITGEGVEDYSTKAAEMVGKEVVAVGYAENYSGTYELTSTGSGDDKVYPTILSISTPSIAATEITLNKTTATVEQGKTLQLEASLQPLGASGTVAWTVEGNDKVTVDQTGLVTVAADAAVNSTATVKASINSLTATCVITVAEALGEITELEKFDFKSSLTKYEAYDATKMDAFVKAASNLGGDTNYVGHVNGKTTDSSLTDPLIGANSSINSVDWSDYNLLKLGSTSKNCKMTFKFTSGLKICKAVVLAAGWRGKSCKLAIGGSSVQAITSIDTVEEVTERTGFKTYTFEFNPTNEVLFESTLCTMIDNVVFYAAK